MPYFNLLTNGTFATKKSRFHIITDHSYRVCIIELYIAEITTFHNIEVGNVKIISIHPHQLSASHAGIPYEGCLIHDLRTHLLYLRNQFFDTF